MSKKPMRGIAEARGADNWGPGQRADGSVNVMTVEQAKLAIAERDAYEQEFETALQPEDELDDMSDIDDDIPEPE